MNLAVQLAQLVSGIAFLYYGLDCLLTNSAKKEFERYRLSQFRKLTGILEAAGGLGTLVGFFSRPLLILSAGGLASLMALGVAARLRIRDPFVALLPALFFCALNFLIFFFAMVSSRPTN